MIRLFDTLAEFYPKEIEKITSRIKHFAEMKVKWMNHEDF
jgi:hypothetical protein